MKKKLEDKIKYDKRNDYKQYILLKDLSNVEINMLRIRTFESIDITRNLKLEEFMMTRLVNLKINLYSFHIQNILRQ